MGKLQFIGALIGELGDRVLDWLEDRYNEKTKEIEEHTPPREEEDA